jgi:hypothetical protein
VIHHASSALTLSLLRSLRLCAKMKQPIRIDDFRYVQLAEHSLAIQEDHGFLLDLILDDRRRGIIVSLGEFYVVFKEFFG